MTKILPSYIEILDLLPDAVCIVDADSRFVFVSAGFERIFGYSREEVLGIRAMDLVCPDDQAVTLQQVERVMAGELQRHFYNRYIHKDGHSVDVQWSARWHPEFGVRIAVAREVTDLRRAERVLEHLASHDPLTGLPNRHRLQHALQEALVNARRTGDRLAVLFLDLDGFKQVNDRGGHETGDRILREVAQRLKQGVDQGDLIARVGGDEFVVVLPGCRDADAARKTADALREILRSSHPVADGIINLDASIGIACYPADGQDPSALLAHADRAMYATKRTQPARPDVMTPPGENSDN